VVIAISAEVNQTAANLFPLGAWANLAPTLIESQKYSLKCIIYVPQVWFEEKARRIVNRSRAAYWDNHCRVR